MTCFNTDMFIKRLKTLDPSLSEDDLDDVALDFVLSKCDDSDDYLDFDSFDGATVESIKLLIAKSKEPVEAPEIKQQELKPKIEAEILEFGRVV